MLTLTMKRASADAATVDRFDALVDAVSDEYSPVISPAVHTQSRALGVTEAEVRWNGYKSSVRPIASSLGLLRGELLVRDGELYALALRQTSGSRGEDEIQQTAQPSTLQFELYCLSDGPNPRFAAQLKDKIDMTLGINLESYNYTNERFAELTEGRRAAALLDDVDLQSARLLEQRSIRDVLKAIKGSEGLSDDDISRDSRYKVGEIDRTLKVLEQRELIEKGVAVFCRKNPNRPILRLSNGQTLADLGRMAVRCACGRALSEERTKTAVYVTKKGSKLLDRSAWLTQLLVDELVQLGVPQNDILIEESFGSEEFDCLALISGDFVAFELKTEEFSLGHAYKFSAKMALLRPDIEVIITADKVEQAGKDHFGSRTDYIDYEMGQDATVHKLLYIEGLDEWKLRLRDLISSIYQADAIKLLSEVLPFASLHPSGLVEVFGRSSSASKE